MNLSTVSRRTAALVAVLAVGAFGASTANAASQPDRPTLTVFTYDSFAGEYGPGGTVKQRFEADCDCALNWVAIDDAGTLLARLKLEGSTSTADVVLGLDTNLMAAARKSGLFAPHGIDTSDLDLPLPWSDDTFVPFDWGWFAFVYDSKRLGAAPESLAELIADEDGPTLVIQDPRTSSPGLGLLLWLREVYGDRAAQAWRKLKPRIVTVTRGWSEAYGMFLAGEADMVLSYTTSPAYHLAVEGEDRYRAAVFSEGHAMQVEVAGIVASTDQPELARRFMTFMLSDGFQSAIPEGNWMYPARLPDSGLPDAFDQLSAPQQSLLTSPETVGAKRGEWIDEWLNAMTGR